MPEESGTLGRDLSLYLGYKLINFHVNMLVIFEVCMITIYERATYKQKIYLGPWLQRAPSMAMGSGYCAMATVTSAGVYSAPDDRKQREGGRSQDNEATSRTHP